MTTANGMIMTGPTVAKATDRADLSLRFSSDQRRLIIETCCVGASQAEADRLIASAEARGLNPLLGDCYFVKRYDTQSRREIWAVQASIDALRTKAEQTGLYAGQDEPEYEYGDGGQVTLARVRVWRHDWPRPAVGVARWAEYVQTTRDGGPTKFWRQMPHNQLAKCAEALALRKAFPAVLARVYIPEEMAQADNEAELRIDQAPRPALPEPKQNGAYERLVERLTSAATVAEVNAVASATARAHKARQISDGDLEAIKAAVKARRAELATPKPAEPEPASDDGHDASEAEAEAMASQYDEAGQ